MRSSQICNPFERLATTSRSLAGLALAGVLVAACGAVPVVPPATAASPAAAANVDSAGHGDLAGPVDLQTMPPEWLRAVADLRKRAEPAGDTDQGGLMPLEAWCAARTLRSLTKRNALDKPPVSASRLTAWLSRQPERVVRNGNLIVADHRGATPPMALYWYAEAGTWKLDPLLTTPYAEPDRGDDHAENRELTVAEATAGIPGTGALYVAIATTAGTLHCSLAEKDAPRTVANFVGLARGLRGFKEGARHDDVTVGTWTRKPFYDGLTVHRVVPGFVIQGGDPEGDGEGGPGYSLADEFSPAWRFDQGGVLGMANGGPNTNGSQFFVTEQATTWLEDRYSLFGRCAAVDLVRKLAAVPTLQDGSTPATPIRIQSMTFERR